MDLSPYKEALLRKRGEILSAGGGVKPLQTTENNSRQGDLADQASGNNEVHIQLKLKQTDAKILQAIEEALWRHGKGHLRRLPRLRRADRAGPAQRHPLDPRLHHLQGKAKLVKATEMLELLREFYRDKLALRQRHVAAARHVKDYDFNNTYQYVIAREDMQVAGCYDAIVDLGGTPEDVPEPDVKPSGKGAAAQNGHPDDRPRHGAQRSSRSGAPASTRCRTPVTARCCA